MVFRDVLEDLLTVTAASRTTLRLDLPDKDLHVDRIVAEAVAAGVRPIGDDSSIDQRALPTVMFLEEERRPLVQNDCLAADPAPPQALIDFYGVKAQMLGPLVRDDHLIGWISVHYTPGPREWSDKDVDALREAIERTQQELDSWEE
jgi:GAF domain-containing protein